MNKKNIRMKRKIGDVLLLSNDSFYYDSTPHHVSRIVLEVNECYHTPVDTVYLCLTESGKIVMCSTFIEGPPYRSF